MSGNPYIKVLKVRSQNFMEMSQVCHPGKPGELIGLGIYLFIYLFIFFLFNLFSTWYVKPLVAVV